MIRYHKDPDAVLDYGFDWSKWLATAETIATSTWTVDAGITVALTLHTDTTTTVWLSGGTAGTSYKAVNRITTNQGRTDDRTLTITAADR